MRNLVVVALALVGAGTVAAQAPQGFTIQQALSAPYATNLTAAPVGSLFAWVEHMEGRNNLWVASPSQAARQLTHNTEDDAQDITSLAWSPDGATIVYVFGAQTGASGKPANPAHLQRPTPVEILLQRAAGGVPMHVGEGRAPMFSPDGKTLFFLRGGQIMTVAVADGRVSAPSSLLFDRGTASGLTLSPDGTLLAYVSHRRTHNFLALYDLAAKKLTFPAPSTGNDSAPIFSRDWKYLAWLRWPWTDTTEFATNRVSANPWSVQVMEVATGKTRMVYQPEANKPGSAEPRMSTGEPRLLFAADDRVLFFAELDGWVHLYAVDAVGKESPTLLTPGGFEVEDAALTPDGQTVLFAGNSEASTRENHCRQPPCKVSLETMDSMDRDRRHLFAVHLGGEMPHAVAITTGKGIETHPILAGGQLLALIATDREPMHVAMVDARGHLSNAQKVEESPLYPAAEFATPQQVIFPSADKLFQIHGQLFLPKALPPANGKRPAILFFHGGPRRQMLLGYPSMDYYSNAYAMNQYLASRGYIVLSVNYRGGIGYGLEFRQCEHCGGDGAAEYADALGAVAYLRSRPDVDASRIGIWGGSYGGYFTALALARNSDLFAAGVDFHGVHEWAREDNATGDWLRSETNDPDDIARIAKRAHASSPMADVDKWKSPVLLIHGDDDPDVAYIQTPMLADALRARKVHVEELIFPDELHGFVLHKDWVTAYEAAANFFDRMLKPAR